MKKIKGRWATKNYKDFFVSGKQKHCDYTSTEDQSTGKDETIDLLLSPRFLWKQRTQTAHELCALWCHQFTSRAR